MSLERYILDSFKQKYGDDTFNDIKEIIKNEVKNSNNSIIVDDSYIFYIFEIAILEKCDVESKKITTIIKKMGNENIPNISLEELQSIHKKSINLIKKYLKNKHGT